MTDDPRIGDYDGRRLHVAEPYYSCGGERLVEVDYHVGDEPGQDVPTEADGA